MNTRLNQDVDKAHELTTKPLQTKKLYLGRDVKPTSIQSIDEGLAARENNKTPTPQSKLSNRSTSDDSTQ